MPVLVRNLRKGPVVFTHKASDTAIEWQGAGDPQGEDVQQVPEAVLKDVNFLKATRRGIYQIEEADEATMAAFEDNSRKWAAQHREDVEKATADSIDRQADEPIVVMAEGDLVDGTAAQRKLKVTFDREALPSEANA